MNPTTSGYALALASLVAPFLAAQAPPPAPPGPRDTYGWDGLRLLRRPSTERKVYVCEPGKPGERLLLELPTLPGDGPKSAFATSYAFQEGAHWLHQRVEVPGEGGTRKGVKVLRSEDGRSWEEAARFLSTPERTAPSNPLPVGKRLWLAHAGFQRFELQGRHSPLALITSRADGGFEVDTLVDMGARDPGAPGFGTQLFAGRPLPVPGGWVVVHLPTGSLWAFTATEGGSVRTRQARVFDSVTERLDHNLPFASVILDAQVDRDGTVLLATRTEEAVLKEPAYLEEYAAPKAKAPQKGSLASRSLAGGKGSALPTGVSPQGKGLDLESVRQQMEAALAEKLDENSPENRARAKALDLAAKRFPEVLWWRFDPVTGKLAKEDLPFAQTLLRDGKDLKAFWFHVAVDGRLVMRDGSPRADVAAQ